MMAEERNEDDAISLQQNCCSHTNKSFKFFSKYSILPCFGLSLYVLDMLTDFNAAYWDYEAGDVMFACITVGLIFAPGFLFALYTSSQYLMMYMGEITCLKAPFIILLSPLLPIWVILRDLRRIIEGMIATCIPSRRESLMEKRKKPSKIYLIKFLEAFTEAAPQLLVRLYRVALRQPMQFSDLRTSEIIQICFSVFVLSLKVVSTHQKSISTKQVLEGEVEIDSKFRLPWFLQIVALVWWICFLMTRFQVLALFSASYGYWVLLVLAIHVFFVFVFQTVIDRKDNLQKLFIYLFGAFVFIFAYVQFNLKTRLKIAVWFPYTIFSIVVFVENSVMLTFWLFYQRRHSGSILAEFFNGTNSVSFEKPEEFGNLTSYTSLRNSTAETIITITENDLMMHCKHLLFIHYGVFALGMISMILTFCSKSIVTANEDGKSNTKLKEENTIELHTLNSPS